MGLTPENKLLVTTHNSQTYIHGEKDGFSKFFIFDTIFDMDLILCLRHQAVMVGEA